MILIYDIASLVLAIAIILFSSVTVFYGIRYLLITKVKRRFDWIVLMQTVVSLAWVLIFGYIAIESIFDTSPITAFSFGSLFIRPVILLSSSAVSIWMYIRYKFEESGRVDRWNLQKN